MKSQSLKKKVFVGLSGGVDSSVSAYLLKKAGCDVVGVFIKVWHPEFLPCDWKAEKRDAMRVCAHLNIPFKMLDLEKVYKKEVIDYMISEYKKGKTPNPDVMCNKYVKFGAFFDYAMKEGADFVATGHYSVNLKNGNHELVKAEDGSKDQSYFLWTITQKQLSKTLFPIGHLKKEEVRKIAEKAGLFTSIKKDSQGLCFIGHVDLKEFLKKYIKTKKGKVLDENKKIIGEHEGVTLYTIGERRGFEIFDEKLIKKPLYVVAKDIKKNTLTVSEKESSNRKEIGEINLVNTNWISESPKPHKKYSAQIRYHGELLKCKIVIGNKNTAVILLEKPQRIFDAGQSVVVYDGKVCIGGGIIN